MSNRHGGSSRSASSSPTDRLLPVTNTSSTNLAPPSPSLPPMPPPLHITVRFSIAALPDLQLDILTPNKTTVVALKHLIRSRLIDQGRAQGDPSSPNEDIKNATSRSPKGKGKPHQTTQQLETSSQTQSESLAASSASKSRLRFIHSGKILPDNAPLSSVLRPPPAPPSDPHGKGKAVEGRHSLPSQRVYVNCSIGDQLSPAELASEAEAAAAAAVSSSAIPSRSPSPAGGLHIDTSPSTLTPRTGIHTNQNTAPPRGFDRLLNAGLSVSEVQELRASFRSITASRFTPDTMPSPDSLRRMEDNWIDNNNTTGAGFGAVGDVDVGEAEEDEGRLSQVVDQLIQAMAVGFFFPLAAMGWLLREEGMLPKRWQVFIIMGLGLSLSVGIVRELTGEGGN